jgi:hypothetical protein
VRYESAKNDQMRFVEFPEAANYFRIFPDAPGDINPNGIHKFQKRAERLPFKESGLSLFITCLLLFFSA